MIPSVHSPRPARPSKRLLQGSEDSDTAEDHYHRTAKRFCSERLRFPLPSPLPSPSPSIGPSPSSVLSAPSHKRKRRRLSSRDDAGLHSRPSKQLRRLGPPSPITQPWTSSVLEWLSQLPRATSAPPVLFEAAAATVVATTVLTPITIESIKRPATAPPTTTTVDMSSSQGPKRQPGSTASSCSAVRPSTSEILYRELIFRNGIIFDPSGLEMEEEIRTLVKTRILKERPADEPPLAETAILDVIHKAVELIDVGETKASELLGTEAFPVRRRGIVEGRNLLWSAEPLPVKPEYQYRLATPKPDFHYGYPLGRKGDWTPAEVDVLEHRAAQPYIQPTRENWCPFLTFELKSEATGGVLYTAENQAVGSAVHSVASLRWLLGQASPSEVPESTAAIAITGALSPRVCVFYVAWFSTARACYLVSMFAYTVLVDKSGVQRCREIVANTIDYGLDVRKASIRHALALLNPTPPHWKMARSAASISDTLSASFSAQDERAAGRVRKE